MWSQRRKLKSMATGLLCFVVILCQRNIHAQSDIPTNNSALDNAKPDAQPPPKKPKNAAEQTPTEERKERVERQQAIEAALENQDFFEAEALLKKFAETTLNENAKFLYYQGAVAKGLYRLNEAEKFFKKSLRKNNKDGDALFEMALLLMEKKRWKDAEVLLYLADKAANLSARKKSELPYYLGVASFESGKIFSARNSFSQLNWANALDPALEQSAAAFLGRINRLRPWSVVIPLTYQYESNMLGLAEGISLPEGFSRRQGSKIIAGMFTQWNGLGRGDDGEGAWGLALRLLTIRALPAEFNVLNTHFIESEVNWSRFLGERLGMFKWAAVANHVSVGGKAALASGLLRLTFIETEVTVGYEADLQKNQTSNRSAYVFRASREWQLWSRGSVSLSLPLEAGAKIPVDKEKYGERRHDISLAPSLGWSPTRRFSIKLIEKAAYESVKDTINPAFSIFRNTAGLTFTFVTQPYLILSSSFSHEFEKKSVDSSSVKKASASFSALTVL